MVENVIYFRPRVKLRDNVLAQMDLTQITLTADDLALVRHQEAVIKALIKVLPVLKVIFRDLMIINYFILFVWLDKLLGNIG